MGKKRKAKPKARKTKCLKIDNDVQLSQETMRTNRDNTSDIINENLWNRFDDQQLSEDLLFESFGRPTMAKGTVYI